MADDTSQIDGGYIVLAKKTLDSDLWSTPPLYMKLWLWMLMKANWKDRDKLKRGQFFTSIEEMRQAMSYKIGYRKITPTRDEIRSAYEAFTKTTMITTTKTTRGMVITICNYELYQNKKNYEAHNEAHDEDTTKPQRSPHHTEERNKEERKKEEIKKPTPPTPPRGGDVETPLPSWLPPEPWEAFVRMRRSIKKPLTVDAKRLAIGKLSKLRDQGHDPTEVLNQSTMNSWQGLFEVRAEKKAAPQKTPEEVARDLLTPKW